MIRLALALLVATGPIVALIENADIRLSDRQPTPLTGFWNFTAPGIQKKLRIEKEWRLQGIANVAQARYELTVKIPPELRTDDFALMMPPASAAVKIFLNGRLVKAKGEVSADKKYPTNSSEAFAWYPIKREFLRNEEAQVLTLEFTGFHGGGGIYGNAHLYFGGIDEIRDRFNFVFLMKIFLAASIFMIGLFHFALVPDRNYRRANLHYVLLSLAMAAHIFGMNGLGYYVFDNFVFNAALLHLIMATFPFTIIGFSLRYFRLRHQIVRGATYAFAIVMATVLLACAIDPRVIPYYLNYGLPIGSAAMAGSLGFAIYAASRGVLARTPGARLVLMGFLTYTATVVNDLVFYFSYAASWQIADVGFLFAVMCIALALAGRLERSSKEQQELNDWQKEIALAAQIQKLALPAASLQTANLQIETLFKPMKIIGGDFFAFHEISDTLTGIFIADVSGHGIAAALTVNMIKSVFVQQKECAAEPAVLMRNMNASLYPHLSEQFITAAYCVIDSATQSIRVAQAGHPPLYFLRRDDMTLEKIKPAGRFFGFAPELTYAVSELDLSQYKRIFLYSDGVIEAGAMKDKPYSATRLEALLLSAAETSGTLLLQKLEADILRHANSPMNTDDDSTCIVIDLKSSRVLGQERS